MKPTYICIALVAAALFDEWFVVEAACPNKTTCINGEWDVMFCKCDCPTDGAKYLLPDCKYDCKGVSLEGDSLGCADWKKGGLCTYWLAEDYMKKNCMYTCYCETD